LEGDRRGWQLEDSCCDGLNRQAKKKKTTGSKNFGRYFTEQSLFPFDSFHRLAVCTRMDKEKWAQEELESDDDSENDLDYQPDRKLNQISPNTY
jgi:hypothetical protein